MLILHYTGMKNAAEALARLYRARIRGSARIT